MILSRPLLMFTALHVVFVVLVSQPSVPFVVRPAIYPGPVRSRAFAGGASSPVTWLVSVVGLGPASSFVLRVLSPLRPILFPFLSLILFLMIRLHLLQPLFRLTRPLLLMTILL